MPARVPNVPSGTPAQTRLFSLIQSLNPPSPAPYTPTAPGTPLDSAVLGTALAAPVVKVATEQPADALWWETIAAPSSSSALASGLPRCPWVGHECTAEGQELVAKRGKGKGASALNPKGKVKGKVKSKPSGSKANAAGAQNGNGKGKASNKAGASLGDKMKGNFDTLKKIKRLHSKLANAARTAEDPYDQPLGMLSLSDDSDSDSEDVPLRRNSKPAGPSLSWNDTGVDKKAFTSHLAAEAGQNSLGIVSERVLSHAGFDATNATALGVLAHVAAEYMVNLGRTLRFYSDRYNSKLSPEQILLHTLSENGVPSLSHIETYVLDIDKYGNKLADLHAKLEKARKDQLEGVEVAAALEEDLLANDAEALARGDFGTVLGEDFFGLAGLGLNQELGSTRLSIPLRLYRGEPKLLLGLTDLDLVKTGLKYRPPPPFVPLTASSISCQIGLLQPIFRLRQNTEAGLIDDFAQPLLRLKATRSKVPATGRIPFKGKRTQDPVESINSLNLSRKRRKKIKKAAAALIAEGGSESEPGLRALAGEK